MRPEPGRFAARGPRHANRPRAALKNAPADSLDLVLGGPQQVEVAAFVRLQHVLP